MVKTDLTEYTPLKVSELSIGDRVILICQDKIERGRYTLNKTNPLFGSEYSCEGRVLRMRQGSTEATATVEWDNGASNVYVGGDLASAGHIKVLW